MDKGMRVKSPFFSFLEKLLHSRNPHIFQRAKEKSGEKTIGHGRLNLTSGLGRKGWALNCDFLNFAQQVLNCTWTGGQAGRGKYWGGEKPGCLPAILKGGCTISFFSLFLFPGGGGFRRRWQCAPFCSYI